MNLSSTELIPFLILATTVGIYMGILMRAARNRWEVSFSTAEIGLLGGGMMGLVAGMGRNTSIALSAAFAVVFTTAYVIVKVLSKLRQR